MAMIGVVVPVYNVEPFLHRCVDSILRQTFSDFELILVDDGSPDRCGEICEEYARKDSRVRVIHQENAGLSAARNAATDLLMAEKTVQWITYIDSDDWVHPQFLECLLNAARDNGVQISVCGLAETAGEDPEVLPEDMQPVIWSAEPFYTERFVNATVACGKLYSCSCIGDTRYPVGKLHEDEFVTYRLLFEQGSLAYISAPLYAYYVNMAGITKKKWHPRRLDAWEAYEQQIAFFTERNLDALVRFRYRTWLDNVMVNYAAAQEAEPTPEILEARKRIRKDARKMLRRMWQRNILEFQYDQDILFLFCPIQTKIYRFLMEKIKKEL